MTRAGSPSGDGARPQRDELALGDLAPVAMLVVSGDGQAVSANDAWCELSGRTRPDSLEGGWLEVVDPADRGRLAGEVEKIRSAGGRSRVDFQITRTTRRWTRWLLRSNGAQEGEPVVVIAVVDVDDDRARQAELYHSATHDPLTDLVNRSQFLAFTEQALRQLARRRGQVAVVFVDLDDFKAVNDTAGHLTGDRVLAAVADRLRRAVRPSDIVARIGGDEFAVLCDGLGGGRQAAAVAQRIAEEVPGDIEIDGVGWPVGAAVGLATTTDAEDSAVRLLDRADRAMYRAKNSRRTAGRPRSAAG